MCQFGIGIKALAFDLASPSSLPSLLLGIVVIVFSQVLMLHPFERGQSLIVDRYIYLGRGEKKPMVPPWARVEARYPPLLMKKLSSQALDFYRVPVDNWHHICTSAKPHRFPSKICGQHCTCTRKGSLVPMLSLLGNEAR